MKPILCRRYWQKRLGAKKAMVLIQRMAYINLIQGGTIDIAVSPQQATISALLGHVRKGDIKMWPLCSWYRGSHLNLLYMAMRQHPMWLEDKLVISSCQ